MKLLSLAGLALVISVVTMHCANGPARPTTPIKVFPVQSVGTKSEGKAVDFTWVDNGKKTSFLEVTSGKVVLLNIWATWCPPCRREIPDLVAIANEMAAKGVVVFGVSLDSKADPVASVKAFAEKQSIGYINVVDNSSNQIADAYGGIQSIPTTFIIDRQGNIVQKIVGSQSKEAFVAALQKAGLN
jgi:thiol-disulfide isomerase/thioredoxin